MSPPGEAAAGRSSPEHSAPGDLLARLLARRDLSVEEARARLARAGVAGAAIDAAVESAEKLGYLDDARLAERLVEQELARRPPPSAEHLQQKLEARGVALEVAARVVRARADRETVAALVAAYVDHERRRTPVRRIYGRLVRLGHAPEAVAALFPDADDREHSGDL